MTADAGFEPAAEARGARVGHLRDLHAAVPPLLTPRLRLRLPVAADFEPYAAMMASPRMRHVDGPMDRERAWRQFATDTASWVLGGLGYWTVEDRATGAYLGATGVAQPPHFPEPELGWNVTAAAEGRGIAFEAVSAARDHAFAAGLATLVSYTDPENRRSCRLAERLGARRDPGAACPYPEDVVYRHPSPDRDAAP